jgi:hypothetical protein
MNALRLDGFRSIIEGRRLGPRHPRLTGSGGLARTSSGTELCMTSNEPCHLPLQPLGLAPLVEGDHVDTQLLGDRGHALTLGRPHPPPDISFDSLAARPH